MRYKLTMDKHKLYQLVAANWKYEQFPKFSECIFDHFSKSSGGCYLLADSFMASMYFLSGLVHLDMVDCLWNRESCLTWEPYQLLSRFYLKVV